MHCGSVIATMGGAVTTVTSDAALSVRILCIDVSSSTIAQLVERMTVNHDVTGSNPVGGVGKLPAVRTRYCAWIETCADPRGSPERYSVKTCTSL